MMQSTIKKYLFLILSIIFVSAAFLFAQDPLQTQESDLWDGIEIDLTKMTVKNNVITVKFKLRNTGAEKHSVKIDYNACYIMDEKNQEKYYVLKDSDGIYIAGPQYDQSGGGRFWFDIKPQKSKGLWMKFPEPTDNPEAISISIPGTPPFDGVEIKK
jgi:hypothetical protein